jgi:hypothetical protein
MMKLARSPALTFLIFGVLTVHSALANAENGDSFKQELTEEEIKTHVGPFGETEAIPEGFKFSQAENMLWRSEHLKNVDRPVRLYYEFIKSGTYEEGFTDAIYLDIIKINEDGTRNAVLDFFTASRKQKVSPDNVTNITGNPVLGVYMQGDVYEMNRLTEGHWRHFQKQIKIALRKNAHVEPVTFEFKGRQCAGEKIIFSPYMKDPHRRDFEQFAGKRYEFIFSEEIPGMLFQIKTIVPGKNESEDDPLIEETLTLVEASFGG